MSNEPTNLRKILFGKLKPWGNRNLLQDKFKIDIQSLDEVVPGFTSRYVMSFFKPHTPKAKFYKKYIDNEAVNYINKVYYLVNQAADEDLRHYWVYTTLNKKLHQFLLDFAQELERQDYKIDYIDPNKQNQLKDREKSEETFIVHYLKHTIILIYLEIQNAFRNYLDEEPLEIADFYRNYFGEPNEYGFITEIPTQDEQAKPKPKIKTRTPKDITIYHSIPYIHYTTAPDNITNLWDCLKKNGFISEETRITDFKKIFSGKEFEKPVIWTGNRSELFYFVKLMLNKHKLIKPMRQRPWEIACNCFVDDMGDAFDFEKIRLLKRPKTTGDQMDACVSHLL